MAWLMKPMRGWSALQQLRTIVLFTVVVFPVAVWVAYRSHDIFTQPDANRYLAMAAGQPAMMPFASRQLGPLLVRLLSRSLHIGIAPAFEVQGALSLLFFVVATAWLLARSGAPRWTLYAVGGLMFWGLQLNALVMPDLLYAALLCGFLLLLSEGRILAACLMMFPMTVSRESTLLTLACFLLVGWKRLKKSEIATAVLATGAATLLVRRMAVDALPNKEHISPMVYLVAKMPWNFLRNVLGLGMWANVYPSCAVPKWQVQAHLGPLHAIGFCEFFPGAIAKTFGLGMTIFGLLPVMVWMVRRQMLRTGGREDLMLRFAILYGVGSFLLAPTLGESFVRLFGYSWPLFLIALPLLLGASGANFISTWAAVAFLGLHLFLTWFLLGETPGFLFPTALVCWIVGWLLLLTTFRSKGPGSAGVVGLAGDVS